MSYSHFFWYRTWTQWEDLSQAQNMVPIWNPMSILYMAVLSKILMVAHTNSYIVSQRRHKNAHEIITYTLAHVSFDAVCKAS